ncbi:hypothetical protein Dimus_024645, partial [Dionaea muscipula]
TLQVVDNLHQQGSVAANAVIPDDIVSNEVGEGTPRGPEKLVVKFPEQQPIGRDIKANEQEVTREKVTETSSDEGWQEANSKNRSANTKDHKFHRTKPDHVRVSVGYSPFSSNRESSHGPGEVSVAIVQIRPEVRHRDTPSTQSNLPLPVTTSSGSHPELKHSQNPNHTKS